MDMAFFWLLFSGCAVCAWLIGYGMGYLRGIREATTADVGTGDLGFSGDGSVEEIEAPMPHWMRRLLEPSRYAGDDQRATRGRGD